MQFSFWFNLLFNVLHYLVLLNQSVAFDINGHSTFLSCLQSLFAVGDTVLRWFKSYCIDLFQCIKIGSTLSELKTLLYGASQGSVPDPILFSIYTALNKVIDGHPFTFMPMTLCSLYISLRKV